MERAAEAWAIWFVGLPGCGKSTLARGVHKILADRGLDVVLLQMDVRRKIYFPEPRYTAGEREQAYAMFADEAAALVEEGRCVLMDGAACRLSMRRHAREGIKRFAEVCVRCDLAAAVERESSRPGGLVMADLYKKAIERKSTGRDFDGLGEVIGVDVPFEEDPQCECVIDNTLLTPAETLGKCLHFVDRWISGV